jgi:hypothetical protein
MENLRVMGQIYTLPHVGNGTLRVYGAGLHITTRGDGKLKGNGTGLHITTRGEWNTEGVWSRLAHYYTWRKKDLTIRGRITNAS